MSQRFFALAGLALMLAMAAPAAPLSGQQTGSITGQVTSARSLAPLANVQVYLVDGQQGVITAQNGRFTIPNVTAGTHQLRAEILGYRTTTIEVTVSAGQASAVEILLSEQALGLDEIVVTGTAGQARRREVGNSITQINVADVSSPPQNMDHLLQAQAPGLNVTQGNGSVGGGAQIRLRGAVSVSQSNQPIIYIDGVRVRSEPYARNQQASFGAGRGNNITSSPLNDINPADIERIEVIKGSAASTLYGTEAAAGVIQIFTKRGSTGAARWTLQVDQGFSQLRPFAPDVDVRPPNEVDPSHASYSGPRGSYSYKYLNMEPYLRGHPFSDNGAAHRQKYALSVSGGGQSLQYFLSGQMEDNLGVLPLDHEERAGLRGNFTFSPLSTVNVQLNTSYNRTDITGTPAGNNAQGLTLNAFRREANYFNEGNPDSIRKVLDQEINTRIDRFIVGGTVTYDPTSRFTNRMTVGYDQAIQDNRNLRKFGYFQAPGGILYTGAHSFETLTLDYVGSFRQGLTDDLHGTFSLGGQSVTSTVRAVRGEAQNFPGPGNPDLDAGTTQLTFENRVRTVNAGFFGQALFAFKDRYFVTAGIRVDGNSAFGDNLGLQSYPKVSGSYVISDEDFWSPSLGDLKLRAAFGQSGRAPGTFDAVKTWNAIGYGGIPAFSPRNQGNPDLGPERTAEIEFGFDWAGFDNRVAADFTWYRQTTTDALFAVQVPPSMGGPLSQQENVGKIQNQGIELNVNLSVIDDARWGLNWRTNLYTNGSEVLDLGGAPPFAAGGGWVEEGSPVMAMRGNVIRNGHLNEDPVTCTDALPAERACFEQNVIFGPGQPTLVVGGGPTLRMPWWGMELSARGEYQGGHYINDGTSFNALGRSIRWPTCAEYYELTDAGRRNETTAEQRFTCDATILRSPFMRPADFFKLRDVTLRVALGEIIPRTSNATLTLSGQNWYRWMNEDFPMFDPEMVSNTGFGDQNPSITEHIPPPASFVASIRLNF